MNKKEHNGWTNYETWVVALWMDNEQATYEDFRERAREVENSGDAQAVADFAEVMKQDHEDSLPAVEGFAADLLNAALSEVNWLEIAEHLCEEIREEVE